MRVLLITDHHASAGGAERYFFDLKTHLQHQPGITVYSMGFAKNKEQGPDFFTLKKTQSKVAKFFWQHAFHPVVYRELLRQIDLFKPDVIHLHNIKDYTRTVLQAVKAYPVVQTIHDYSVICPTGWNVHQDLQPCPTGLRPNCFWQHQTKFKLWSYLAISYSQHQLKRWLQKSVHAFMSPSPLLTHYLELNGFKNVVTIPPFITQMHPAPQKEIEPFHFLFVGQLGRHKGIDHLLDEFAHASIKEPKLQLTLVGDGPEYKHLKSKINALKLTKQVHLVGWQQDLSSYYAKCQAVIFPSIGLESFGLVITESMCAGRAVIATHRGHSPHLIDDEVAGLLYDPLKTGDLSNCILKLALQPDLAKQMGARSYQKAMETMDNDAVMRKIVRCYEQVVEVRKERA